MKYIDCVINNQLLFIRIESLKDSTLKKGFFREKNVTFVINM